MSRFRLSTAEDPQSYTWKAIAVLAVTALGAIAEQLERIGDGLQRR